MNSSRVQTGIATARYMTLRLVAARSVGVSGTSTPHPSIPARSFALSLVLSVLDGVVGAVSTSRALVIVGF
jgi:hypothetical protein